MNKKIYPYHKSLSTTLQSIDAALVAARLVRQLEFMMDVSATEVELIIYLAGQRNPSTFETLCSTVAHVSSGRVKRLIKNLVSKNLIQRVYDGNDTLYTITIMAADAIKYLDRDKLTK